MDEHDGSNKISKQKSSSIIFERYIASKVASIANSILYYAAKLLMWIGRKAMAAAINSSATYVISTMIRDSMRFASACMSVGGLIAAIIDYVSDKKFDGWIRI